jgi:hypothetical protein
MLEQQQSSGLTITFSTNFTHLPILYLTVWPRLVIPIALLLYGSLNLFPS